LLEQFKVFDTTMNNEFYSLSAKSITGEQIEMSKFKGKVVLIVNTASKCGFTPQYEGLEKLNKTYKDKGLEILGFPCNQFGSQEPGTEKEIVDNCLINYGVSFQMFSKVNVNGNDAHPIFKFLKEELKGILGKDIKWNFAKFLIDRNGNPVKRYAPVTKPESLASDIEKHL
jgi:glutathione peroxidase